MWKKKYKISVIGGGLAGCEAANYLASVGIEVDLYEKRLAGFKSPAHHSDKLSELVCSNSLKNVNVDNASGVFKKEGAILNSLLLKAAYQTAVPAGGALACDRQLFSEYIDQHIKNNKLINVIGADVTKIPSGIVIIATGPLTAGPLLDELTNYCGANYFYDASAPLIEADSIDFSKCFLKNRYDEEGDGDYINCPFNKEEYERFYQALINAPTVPLKQFEQEKYFSACQPIEVIAKSGARALSFGPLKPRGLNNKEQKYYAVCQLRQDNVSKSLYSLVGFQTNLTYLAQKEVFRLIPGLEKAQFARYGLMHRNTYINSPLCLNPYLNLKTAPHIFIAGQLNGVEGYVESAISGIIAAVNAARLIQNKELLTFPSETFIYNLINYITSCNPKNFQPMNINWGLVNVDKKDRATYYQISCAALQKFVEEHELFRAI